MRKLLTHILTLLFVSNSFGQTQTQKFIFLEKDYGIYKSKVLRKDTIFETTSIEHSGLGDILQIKKTDIITAKLGTEFGVEYLLESQLNDTISLDIEWIYPNAIIDPIDNKKIKSIKYGIALPTNFKNNSNYILEKEFEVVKGNWQLKIYYNDKVIYNRKFILV